MGSLMGYVSQTDLIENLIILITDRDLAEGEALRDCR
jgi:hypothetical protein